MSDPYVTNVTRWLNDAPDPDTFWAEVCAYPPYRGIRLHLRSGQTDHGPFGGTGEVTGRAYAPEPDGYAAIVASSGESLRNLDRTEIVGFTPLE